MAKKINSLLNDIPIIDESKYNPNWEGSAEPETYEPDPKHDSLYRIQQIRLENIKTDLYQSRGEVIPRDLSFSVFHGEITPTEAINEWKTRIEQSSNEAEINNFEELVNLSTHIDKTGLLHPIQVYKLKENWYQIISGERRFWAFWYLYTMGNEKFATIPCVEQAGKSDLIQITENSDSLPLTAIGKARASANLYLHQLGIYPQLDDATTNNYWDYFKLVNEDVESLFGQKRLPNRFWEDIQTDTGMTRKQIIKYLNLLTLPIEALEIADKWRLSLHILLPIIDANEIFLREIVELAAFYALSKKDVERLASLSRLPNSTTYRRAVEAIKNPSRESKNNQIKSRRPPIELSSLKVLDSLSRLKKVTDGDYSIFARRIIGNVSSDEASALIADFQSMLNSLKKEHDLSKQDDSKNSISEI